MKADALSNPSLPDPTSWLRAIGCDAKHLTYPKSLHFVLEKKLKLSEIVYLFCKSIVNISQLHTQLAVHTTYFPIGNIQSSFI
ncbi:hypothetical protein [Chitinimonas sp. BJB300]|uniref:hypothetical protein n=1 Tax=Chitinimonas sp. BJB300 TaxID=1559339 RepID=UPI0011119D96|nr:hypothetical protein [Chitinimonas sp. BJB300]TSJ89003.1 hypothetical protein FG002_008945 [Chitinimonas sp. BJB300]